MKRRNKLLNIAMSAVIVLIAVSAVIGVGSIRGWFDKSTDNAGTKDVLGIASIERSGIVYSVNSQTKLRDGDILTTRSGSSVTVDAGENSLVISENTQVKVVKAAKDDFSVKVKSGEIFTQIEKGSGFLLELGGYKLNTQEAVFSSNVQTGSCGVNIFSGEVKLSDGDKTVSAKEGETISCIGTDGLMTVAGLQAASLNEFNLTNVKKTNEKITLCFSKEDIDGVVEARNQEIQNANQERMQQESQVIAKGGTSSNSSEENPAAGEAKNSGSSNKSSRGKSGENKGDSSAVKEESKLSCTISIRCDTILNNMGDLTAGKSQFVPSNGVIFGTTRVEFKEGETVLDVLKRACDSAGIQLEYSYTPMYSSYYIEGINNLYEFDCGGQSGWMFKVNGWFPNYGCSVYTVKDGDVIVWCYTCKGLGKDVGAGGY